MLYNLKYTYNILRAHHGLGQEHLGSKLSTISQSAPATPKETNKRFLLQPHRKRQVNLNSQLMVYIVPYMATLICTQKLV